MTRELQALFDRPLVFGEVPHPVPGELRPLWRVSVLVLALRKCGHAGSASVKKVHVLGWALQSSEHQRQLLARIGGETEFGPVVRFEPSMFRAIDLALGEGLVALARNGRLVLTEKGVKLADSIEASGDCCAPEVLFLNTIGRISEPRIDSLLRWERA